MRRHLKCGDTVASNRNVSPLIAPDDIDDSDEVRLLRGQVVPEVLGAMRAQVQGGRGKSQQSIVLDARHDSMSI